MKCQYCNHNEAEQTFRVFMMGEVHEVHLCNECAQRLQQYASVQQGGFGGRPAAQRQPGENPFPHDAGESIKRRRMFASLRTRLQAAVQREDYEEAALLRDELASMEKEVYVYES